MDNTFANSSSSWVAAALRRVGDFFFSPSTRNKAARIRGDRSAVTIGPGRDGDGARTIDSIHTVRALDFNNPAPLVAGGIKYD